MGGRFESEYPADFIGMRTVPLKTLYRRWVEADPSLPSLTAFIAS